MKLLQRPFREMRLPYLTSLALSYLKIAVYGVHHGRSLRAAGVQILNKGGIRLGDRVALRSYPDGDPHPCRLRTYFADARILIGDDVTINGSVIHCNLRVEIGSHTRIGPGCILCDNDSHVPVKSIAARSGRPPDAPIRLGRNVWLGMRTIVLKGVSIGDNTIVAAGSIVTRDLPADVLAGGIPARTIKALE